MDSSTLVFVAVLAAAFLVLRWIITPIPQSVPEEFNIPDPSSSAAASGRHSGGARSRAPRRQVNDSMVEIVQAIGPQLSRSQIIYSLERTGNVEDTVNAYMETGSLPYPPGESAPVQPAQPEASARSSGTKAKGPINLLEKYDISPELVARADENGVVDAADETSDSLQKRRVEMILKARKRLEKTLSEPALQ